MNSTKLIGEHPDSKAIFALKDLQGWARKGPSLAVLGSPIGHSISPVIHNAALSKMASDRLDFADWQYFRFEVPSQRLKDSLPEFAKSGFRGLNLTIPHKVEALDAIDSIDAEAAAMGAVNTLVFSENGGCDGFNTDGFGLECALEDDFGVSLDGATIVLLGAGGAARAAATRFLGSGCSELWIGNRSADRLERLRNVLVVGEEQRVETFALDQVPSDLPCAAGVLVVNATSLGLGPEDDSPLDLSRFASGALAYDMIYNPAETAFLRAARAHGFRAANGLSMLVRQAARSLEIWTGAEVPAEPMFTAARKALEDLGERA